MIPTDAAVGVPPEAWLDAPRELEVVPEVVDSRIVNRPAGGNPERHLAAQLARAFEEQWPGCRAGGPGYWALATNSDGSVLTGRVVDLLVVGKDLGLDALFDGRPDVVVDVWPPGRTLAEARARRAEFRTAGARALLAAQLTDSGGVLLEWFINEGSRWELAVAASGAETLAVVGPRRFSVTPDDLR